MPTRHDESTHALPQIISKQKENKTKFQINPLDDILIPETLTQHPINAALTNPHLITVITKQGGHAGWISANNTSWDIPIALKFFSHIATRFKGVSL